MSRICFTLLAPIMTLALAPNAAAQYYRPNAPLYTSFIQPAGIGVDPGLSHTGFNPNVGIGLGPVGTGLGAGIGLNGVGGGLNAGAGPFGVSTNSGLSRKGIGTRSTVGIGNTGGAFEGGFSRGGLGFGTNARVLGVGGGVSAGVGKRGPSAGASLAFGNVGTLLLGSHRNSFPGARQTAFHTIKAPNAPYYVQQNYGKTPFYTDVSKRHKRKDNRRQKEQPVSSPTSLCAAPWTC